LPELGFINIEGIVISMSIFINRWLRHNLTYFLLKSRLLFTIVGGGEELVEYHVFHAMFPFSAEFCVVEHF
jgi:hypothetical protein